MLDWLFGKKKEAATTAQKPQQPLTGKAAAQAALLEQMKRTKSELGEETIQKMAMELRAADLKKAIQKKIDTDANARDRILDEIRFQMDQDRKK